MLGEITDYICKWDEHLDDHFGALELSGKRLLVMGAGWGTEVLWALRRGVGEVVGIDPRSDERAYVENALARIGRGDLAGRFALHRATALTANDLGTFDLAMSNNVVEHIDGLSANLAALRRFLPRRGGRVHIFADPLFYSSKGHHLPIGVWEHLAQAQEAIRARVTPNQWREYREGLNGMRVTDFLDAVREAGMILLEFATRVDPNLDRFIEMRQAIPSAIKPMDLCLSGVSCTLAFPENL